MLGRAAERSATMRDDVRRRDISFNVQRSTCSGLLGTGWDFRRGRSAIATAVTTVCFGCAAPGGQQQATASERPSVSQITGSIRFAIQVGRDAVQPIYIALNDEYDQPGWVRVFREGERVYLRERCEIPNCGEPVAVCGAAIPLIRDLKSDSSLSSVEFTWDGITSVIDPASGCESRRPAMEGTYIARFCYSTEAEVEPGAEGRAASPGTLVDATCVENPFTLQDSHVALELP